MIGLRLYIKQPSEEVPGCEPRALPVGDEPGRSESIYIDKDEAGMLQFIGERLIILWGFLETQIVG